MPAKTSHTIDSVSRLSNFTGQWKSLVTWYPPRKGKMREREAAKGDGVVVEWDPKMIAAVAVGKWESRGLGGISKRGGKLGLGFPPRGFSTAASFGAALKMRGLCRLVTSI